jgi:hypothetical protein
MCLSIRHVCVFHRHGLMKRGRRTRAHAVQRHSVDTRTRAQRGCIEASYHTRSHMHIRRVHRYMHISDPCMPITQPHTRAHDVAGRFVGICNRTHVHRDGDAATCTLTAYSSPKHPSIYRYRTRPSLNIDTNLCTPMARSTRARSHRRSCPSTCARTQCMPQTGDRYEGDDL